MIRLLDPVTDADACDAIVRGLPGWFGNDEGIAECAAAVRTHRGYVHVDDMTVDGFLTLEPRTSTAWEITWIAVAADRRGEGLGTALIEHAIGELPPAVELLLVKTLSDREDPGAEYAATRAFYLAVGFEPLAELDIWGPNNPCQLMGRRLTARTT